MGSSWSDAVRSESSEVFFFPSTVQPPSIQRFQHEKNRCTQSDAMAPDTDIPNKHLDTKWVQALILKHGANA